MGLFLASVIIPSQCPKFFSKERSEKLAAALSEVSNTLKKKKKKIRIKRGMKMSLWRGGGIST